MRFVLVHGGLHAAWCWERTIDALQALGHDAAAVDLPGHGARLDEESTLANRRDAVVTAMQADSAEKCVLVGHSGGGFDATLAADARPDLVHHIVYLAAALPREGRTYPEAMAMRDAEEGPVELGDDFELRPHYRYDDELCDAFTHRDGKRRMAPVPA